MSTSLIATIIAGYFIVLLSIAFITGKNSNNDTFFLGNRQSPWYIVSFGMIGATLSGVTFISVPGWVKDTGFTYMQMAMGYFFGYLIIAKVLLPTYYKYNVTSIYSYLEERFGSRAHKTGAAFFLLSRTIGASFRLYLVASVLQYTLLSKWNIHFSITVAITIALIWLYTFRSGIKTIIWTDTLQTLMLLVGIIIAIIDVSSRLDLSFTEVITTLQDSQYSRVFIFEDWSASNNFFKHFFSGIFITIVMTGLDQDMMQKNLSCRTLKESQRNMRTYGLAFIPANLIFLALGALLLIFADQNHIILPEKTDNIFPYLATGGFLSPVTGIFFILGLIAAAYSSADSALTSLTTSLSIDFLKIERYDARKQLKLRYLSHGLVSITLLSIIILFNEINNEAVVSSLFKAAGYTYGPLLGLFFIGLFTKIRSNDKIIPLICIASPILTSLIEFTLSQLFSIKVGYEILMLNGAITSLGLYFIRTNSCTKS